MKLVRFLILTFISATTMFSQSFTLRFVPQTTTVFTGDTVFCPIEVTVTNFSSSIFLSIESVQPSRGTFNTSLTQLAVNPPYKDAMIRFRGATDTGTYVVTVKGVNSTLSSQTQCTVKVIQRTASPRWRVFNELPNFNSLHIDKQNIVHLLRNHSTEKILYKSSLKDSVWREDTIPLQYDFANLQTYILSSAQFTVDLKGKTWIPVRDYGLLEYKKPFLSLYSPSNSPILDLWYGSSMVNSKGEMVFIGSNPVKNTSGMSVKSDTGWTTQILYAPFTATGAIPFSGRVVMDSANTYWVTLNDVCFRILNGKNVIQRRDSSTGLDASKVHIPYGCDSAGTVWVTSKDVSKFWISFYKDSTWYDIKGPDTSKRKWIGTVMDKMGRTWILRDDALFMCNSKQWFSYDVSDLPLSSGYVFGIAIDTNMNLWIITSSHKLYAVNPNGLSGVPLGPVVLTTSVNEEPDADVGALSLSPNPASDFVKYHVKPDVVRGYITIHDYTGRIVKNVPLTMLQGEITTDDLVNGVYMFRIGTICKPLLIQR